MSVNATAVAESKKDYSFIMKNLFAGGKDMEDQNT
jgi:hypothetical protein